jgi:hypothetical protein
MARAKRLLDCPIPRRMFVRRGTLNLTTGKDTLLSEGWERKACGTPLFSDRTMCDSCQREWQQPRNYFACSQCDEPRKRDDVTCLRSECQEKEAAANRERTLPKRRKRS